MREFSLPPLVPPLRSGGLADSVYRTAEQDPHLPQIARRSGARWVTMTAAAFRDEVAALAKGLLAEGVGLGDRVAVMARTRYEWTLFNYALWSVGAELVPVYPTSSAEQVGWILSEARVTAVVVEHEDHAMTVGTVCGTLPDLRRIWQLDDACLTRLREAGRPVPDDLLDRHRLSVLPQSTAVVAYTSGTTGRPRGCLITHANLAAECDTLLAGWGRLLAGPGEQPATLAFLPLAHVYGLMVQVSALRGGVLLGHQPDLKPEELLPALASFRPTYLHAVPHIYERILRAARLEAQEEGRERQFESAVGVAVRYAEAEEKQCHGTGWGPGPVLKAAHRRFDRAVYARVRQMLGGRVRHAGSGGSPLNRELGLFFAGAGITIFDGYGLTETTAAVTAQPVGRTRFGTVGRPLPGSALYIAPDGEVWVRGSTVFAGYLGDRGDREPALHDGWFPTGDVGSLDDDGYLTITGRKKDVIITSGGKSVCPLVLEERLRAHPLICQCVVVGDNRPYIAALITLDPEALERWQRVMGGRTPGARPAVTDPELLAEVQRAVSTANTAVSRAESIRAFRILPSQFTVAEGMLTPSLKLRRGAIVKAYAAAIEELYAP